MARTAFDKQELRRLLQREKIATLSALKDALQTSSTMTVFRKLKELGYFSSYSHRGKYYTLVDIPRFNEQGLWSCRSVWFSQHGNLLETSQRFVESCDAGVTAAELQGQLSVEVKEPLLKLFRDKQIDREEIGGVYVYLSHEKGQRRSQRLRRVDHQAALEIGASFVDPELSDELKAAIILFYSLLDEKQRRLFAGLEAQKIGHGGDRTIAEFLGLDPHTVARGRRDLFGDQVDRERVRKKGAGRKSVEKKRRR